MRKSLRMAACFAVAAMIAMTMATPECKAFPPDDPRETRLQQINENIEQLRDVYSSEPGEATHGAARRDVVERLASLRPQPRPATGNESPATAEVPTLSELYVFNMTYEETEAGRLPGTMRDVAAKVKEHFANATFKAGENNKLYVGIPTVKAEKAATLLYARRWADCAVNCQYQVQEDAIVMTEDTVKEILAEWTRTWHRRPGAGVDRINVTAASERKNYDVNLKPNRIAGLTVSQR